MELSSTLNDYYQEKNDILMILKNHKIPPPFLIKRYFELIGLISEEEKKILFSNNSTSTEKSFIF